ncbi:MAG TPA: hypothetical protein VFT99_07630, partial [Roseiflexaceae bacterium]|nr:hypothetical protein [Roseiflexaceae bacterium]
ARLDVAFWEKLLGKQMEAEVDDIVRKVLFKGGEDNTISEDKVSTNLREAYRNRGRLSEIVQRELQHLVGRWGVSVREVALDFYITNPEILRGLRGSEPFKLELERERERYEAHADNEAYRIRATGKATAARIRELVQEVKEAEPELQPDSIEEIVVSALLAEAFEDSESLIDGTPAGRRPAPGGSGPASPPDASRNGKAR